MHIKLHTFYFFKKMNCEKIYDAWYGGDSFKEGKLNNVIPHFDA